MKYDLKDFLLNDIMLKIMHNIKFTLFMKYNI